MKGDGKVNDVAEKLKGMGLFVSRGDFDDYKKEVDERLEEINKMKDSLSNYIDSHKFKDFCDNTTT